MEENKVTEEKPKKEKKDLMYECGEELIREGASMYQVKRVFEKLFKYGSKAQYHFYDRQEKAIYEALKVLIVSKLSDELEEDKKNN